MVRELDAREIPFMLTGSYGSSFHGEPRTTNDIDFVIAPTEEKLEALVESLGESYYVSSVAAREAWKTRGSFNVIDASHGVKADLILRKNRPFSDEEFRRRIPARILGVSLTLASCEDTILAKLEWSSLGDSERQFRDAVGVIAIQTDRLDEKYLRRWSRELEIEPLLERALEEGARRASGVTPPEEST
jgi:hypothetical protein